MNLCNICRESIILITSLPCQCQFCYSCILRHISARNYCPGCFTSPFHVTDLVCLEANNRNENKELTNIKMENGTFKTNKMPKLKPFFYKKMNNENLKKECKRFNLKLGTREEMIDRLKEFYLLYSIEKKTKNSLSLYGLSCVVHKTEKSKRNNVNVMNLVEKNIETICEIKKKYVNK